MKILSCNIENFGTLNHVRCDLKEGLNALNEGNGWGKTTFAAFILSMLYGISNKEIADIGDIRTRYMPWQGGRFGGSLVFETENGRFSITRYFGETPEQDTCKVTDSEGRDITDQFTNPGEEILGIDSDGFRNSAFVFQNDLRLENGESVKQRLRELSGSSGDRSRYERALKGLSEEAEALREKEKAAKLLKEERAENPDITSDEVIKKAEYLRTKREQLKSTERELGKREKALNDAKEELESFRNRMASKGNRTGELVIAILALITAFVLLFIGALAIRIIKIYIQYGIAAEVLGIVLLIVGILLIVNRSSRLRDRQYDEEVLVTRENAARRSRDEVSERKTRIKKEIAELEPYEGREQDIQKKNSEQDEKAAYVSRRLRLIEKTEEAMNKAIDSMSQHYLDPLRRSFSEIYSVLYPDGPEVVIGDDFSITVDGLGEMRKLDSQSRGTQDLIDLCMRFALVNVLFFAEKPCMVLDDVLNNLDDDRINKVINALEKMADSIQIVYLTCNTDRMPGTK